MDSTDYKASILQEFQRLKRLAEDAITQVPEADLFRQPDPEANSIAVSVKHMAGNMRSRWTDFLTTNGDKPDRQRDREFIIEPEDSWPAIQAAWERGWALLFEAIEPLRDSDYDQIVQIRREQHKISNGLVSISIVPAEHVAAYREGTAACHALGEKLEAGETANLCGSWDHFGALMAQGAKMEQVELQSGGMMLLTSADPAVVTGLHEWVERNQVEMKKMMAAKKKTTY